MFALLRLRCSPVWVRGRCVCKAPAHVLLPAGEKVAEGRMRANANVLLPAGEKVAEGRMRASSRRSKYQGPRPRTGACQRRLKTVVEPLSSPYAE